MREAFSVNGQFTEESKQDLIKAFANYDSYSPAKQTQIFADMANTADYGKLSYVKQMHDFIHEYRVKNSGSRTSTLLSDVEGTLRGGLERLPFNRPLFSVNGQFTAESKKEVWETLENFATYSPEKQTQIMSDLTRTANHADSGYLNGLEEELESIVTVFPDRPSHDTSKKMLEIVSQGIAGQKEQKRAIQKQMGKVINEEVAPMIRANCLGRKFVR